MVKHGERSSVLTFRLIIMLIRFRALDFDMVAKIRINRAKSRQDSGAKMVLGPIVFLLA